MFKSIISADETFYLKKNNSTYQEKNKNRTIETLKPLYSNLYNKIFIRKTLIDYFITDSSFEDNFKKALEALPALEKENKITNVQVDFIIEKLEIIFNDFQKKDLSQMDNDFINCITQLGNFTLACPEGIFNRFELITNRLWTRYGNNISYHEDIYSTLNTELEEFITKNQIIYFISDNLKYFQHISKNIHDFFVSQKLLEYSNEKKDYSATKENYTTIIYYFFVIKYATPNQQIKPLLKNIRKKLTDITFHGIKIDTDKIDHIEKSIDNYLAEVNKIITLDDDLKKILIGGLLHHTWIKKFPYLVSLLKNSEYISFEFSDEDIYCTDEKFYYLNLVNSKLVNHQKNPEILIHEYFPGNILIQVAKGTVGKCYLAYYDPVHFHFVATSEKRFFSAQIDSELIIPSLDNLYEANPKILLFNNKYSLDNLAKIIDNRPSTIDLVLYASELQFNDKSYNSIKSKIGDKFNTEMQIAKIEAGFKRIYNLKNNKLVHFNSIELEKLKSLNINQLVDLGNILIFIYNMFKATAFKITTKYCEYFFDPSILIYADIFAKKNNFFKFIDLLLEKPHRLRAQYLMVFCKYIISQSMSNISDELKDIDQLFVTIKERESTLNLLFHAINSTGLHANKNHWLKKLFKTVYNNQNIDVILKNFSNALSSNLIIGKKHTKFSINPDTIEESISTGIEINTFGKFDHESFMDLADLKNSAKDFYGNVIILNKILERCYKSNNIKEEFKTFSYHENISLAFKFRYIYRSNLTKFIYMYETLFSNFQIFIMIILMQAIIFSFISLAMSLFFLELSLGLILFHCLDRCFFKKFHFSFITNIQ